MGEGFEALSVGSDVPWKMSADSREARRRLWNSDGMPPIRYISMPARRFQYTESFSNLVRVRVFSNGVGKIPRPI